MRKSGCCDKCTKRERERERERERKQLRWEERERMMGGKALKALSFEILPSIVLWTF